MFVFQIALDVIVARLSALLLIALLVSIPVFVVAFAASFLYDWLVDKYPKTPKFLIMWVCVFIACLVVLLLLEVYLGYTIAQALAALGK